MFQLSRSQNCELKFAPCLLSSISGKIGKLNFRLCPIYILTEPWLLYRIEWPKLGMYRLCAIYVSTFSAFRISTDITELKKNQVCFLSEFLWWYLNWNYRMRICKQRNFGIKTQYDVSSFSQIWTETFGLKSDSWEIFRQDFLVPTSGTFRFRKCKGFTLKFLMLRQEILLKWLLLIATFW